MRYYSKYLAMQLAAMLAGCRPDPVYLDTGRRDVVDRKAQEVR